jgi:shikimate kinase
MQSRAVGVAGAGHRNGPLSGGVRRAAAASLRVGGTAGAAALRARGAKPVAPLCCVKTSRGLLFFPVSFYCCRAFSVESTRLLA